VCIYIHTYIHVYICVCVRVRACMFICLRHIIFIWLGCQADVAANVRTTLYYRLGRFGVRWNINV